MDASQVIPVGAIVPFGGDVTNTDTVAWLKGQGWLPCDGSSVTKKEYIDLFFAIESSYGGGGSNFNLPDLRGNFPRGVNGNRSPAQDPDNATRTAVAVGGNVANNVGSGQPTATGPPTATGFSTSTSAQHAHPVQHAPVNNNAYAIAGSYYGIWNEQAVNTNSAGAHTHAVSGGDKESRPLNVNVNYIIKFQSAGS
jgi:microcystin-dependent protein